MNATEMLVDKTPPVSIPLVDTTADAEKDSLVIHSNCVHQVTEVFAKVLKTALVEQMFFVHQDIPVKVENVKTLARIFVVVPELVAMLEDVSVHQDISVIQMI